MIPCLIIKAFPLRNSLCLKPWPSCYINKGGDYEPLSETDSVRSWLRASPAPLPSPRTSLPNV